MQMKCIVPFVRFSQQSAQRSDKKRQKRRQKEQRKKRVKRRKKSFEKNTRNLLSLILKSTPSYSGTYHILDGEDFLNSIVKKSNLNIENLNSKNI